MKTRLPLLILAITAFSAAAAQADRHPPGPHRMHRPHCELPWLYFDLGANTLVDTQTTNFKQVYYMPGALEYLTDLRSKGYHLGMLINIPQSWGDTQEAKLAATQKFLLGLWTDSRPFDWDLFDLGAAFPPSDAERKPAPYLFEQAAKRAHDAGCDAVYQGTIADEIPAAQAAGMIGIRLGAGLWDGSYYYPEAKLRIRAWPQP